MLWCLVIGYSSIVLMYLYCGIDYNFNILLVLGGKRIV